VAGLAARQYGVVARSQLRALGVTDASIANSVANGRLHPVFRGVFAVGHPHIGDHGRMFAAVLACGKGTVVSHLAAAALLGLHERPPPVVDVIARGESGRGIDGIRSHQVPRPNGEEGGHCDSVPCTSPSRTLVDLAGMLGERSLRRKVERAAVLRILDVPATERVMARARRRGAPVLRAILGDWRAAGSEPGTGQPGSQPHLRSELEARLLALIGAARLPLPLCNRRVEADGHRIEVDFLWPEQRLVVETDGERFHDNPVAFERDRMRDRALHLSGYRVVRMTHSQIDSEPEAAISTIRRLLANDSG
jgi:very-short-patch-repair endonuclease